MKVHEATPVSHEPANPFVVIAADYGNVDQALRYEEQLQALDFDTQWVIAPETLQYWAKLAAPLLDPESIPRHPYGHSATYRRSVESTLKDAAFHKSRIAVIKEASVVLGVNHVSRARGENVLTSQVSDSLLIGVGFGKLVMVSEKFPGVSWEEKGSFRDSALNQRAMELNALGIRRAKGDMKRVRELYDQSLAAQAGGDV